MVQINYQCLLLVVRTQNLIKAVMVSVTEEQLTLPEEGSTVHTLAALKTITFSFIFGGCHCCCIYDSSHFCSRVSSFTIFPPEI